MVKILGIDIPPGLTDAWAKIFQFTDNSTQNNFVIKSAVPTRGKKILWNSQSLFVRWQSLYDGFDAPRKGRWTDYWLTLPYGSHSGAGGWPGSGFSAFVYLNAPRFKAGLDLLLDPGGVLGPEILINGGFSGNADGWTLSPSYGDLAYDDFCLKATSLDDIVEGEIVSTDEFETTAGKYRVSFALNLPSTMDSASIYIGLADSSDFWIVKRFRQADLIFDDAWHTYFFDQQSGDFPGVDPSHFKMTYFLTGGTGNVFIDSFSLKKYS